MKLGKPIPDSGTSNIYALASIFLNVELSKFSLKKFREPAKNISFPFLNIGTALSSDLDPDLNPDLDRGGLKLTIMTLYAS